MPTVIYPQRPPVVPGPRSVIESGKAGKTTPQLELMTVSQVVDRPVLLPPNVPAERVKEIREAFKATRKDPDFLAEIKKKSMGLDPVYGEEMTDILAKAFATSPDVIAAARETLGGR